MTTSDSDASRASRNRAKERIIGPVSRELRIAGWLSVLAGMLWPIQAAALVWAVSGRAAGEPPFDRALIAAALFFLCAVLRALLEHRSGALLFDAADHVIAGERAALLAREARFPAAAGSA